MRSRVISSDISEIERLADAAWPAAEQVALGPWKLRASGGVTHRANSVFAVTRAPVPDVTSLIAAAEDFYDARGLWTVFHISDAVAPADLDRILEARGYAVGASSEVWTASVADVAACTAGGPTAGDLVASPRPDQVWFDCAYPEPEPRRSLHEAIVLRIAQPTLFVSIREAGVAIACGFVVSGGSAAGIFSMKTHAAHRGRGLARRVLEALARWAAERGNRGLYLQVSGDNAVAHSVYRRCGFERAYSYHYRVRKPELPAADPV